MQLANPPSQIRSAATPMGNIGFDAHSIGSGRTGNETYAAGLLAGFEAIGVTVHAYVVAGTPVGRHRLHVLPFGHALLRVPITSLACRRDLIDLYHGSYVLPPLLRCPAVLTVHDISFAHHPEWLPRSMAARMSLLVPVAMRRARQIITVSHAVKMEIMDRYDVPAAKIAVTYLAPKPRPEISPRRSASAPYLLYVGNLTPRKNVAVLLRALGILQSRGLSLPLVIAGNVARNHSPDIDRVLTLAHDLRIERLVRFEGYVSDDRIQNLYSGCTALVHSAWNEGFGITPLEAMQAGVPVIASDIPAIREVTGGAALLIDPGAAELWADGIARVVGDDELRRSMRAAGQTRARFFSWERCAQETAAVYAAALLS